MRSATNVYWSTNAGKSMKSIPSNIVCILVLQRWPGSEIWIWWRQAREINDTSAFWEGFASGIERVFLVHFPASQPFRD